MGIIMSSRLAALTLLDLGWILLPVAGGITRALCLRHWQGVSIGCLASCSRFSCVRRGLLRTFCTVLICQETLKMT